MSHLAVRLPWTVAYFVVCLEGCGRRHSLAPGAAPLTAAPGPPPSGPAPAPRGSCPPHLRHLRLPGKVPPPPRSLPAGEGRWEPAACPPGPFCPAGRVERDPQRGPRPPAPAPAGKERGPPALGGCGSPAAERRRRGPSGRRAGGAAVPSGERGRGAGLLASPRPGAGGRRGRPAAVASWRFFLGVSRSGSPGAKGGRSQAAGGCGIGSRGGRFSRPGRSRRSPRSGQRTSGPCRPVPPHSLGPRFAEACAGYLSRWQEWADAGQGSRMPSHQTCSSSESWSALHHHSILQAKETSLIKLSQICLSSYRTFLSAWKLFARFFPFAF